MNTHEGFLRDVIAGGSRGWRSLESIEAAKINCLKTDSVWRT